MPAHTSKLSKSKWNNVPNNWRVLINSDVDRLIVQACRRSQNKEWSGLVFFDRQGDDFIVRDITYDDHGTNTFTKFTWQGEHTITVYEKRPLFFGHIHMHPHGMGTQPSSIDDEMLYDGSERMKYFMMLIVNLEGTYSARIGFRYQEEERVITLGSEEITLPACTKFYVADLEVVVEADEDLDRRISDVMARKAEKEKRKAAKLNKAGSKSVSGKSVSKSSWDNLSLWDDEVDDDEFNATDIIRLFITGTNHYSMTLTYALTIPTSQAWAELIGDIETLAETLDAYGLLDDAILTLNNTDSPRAVTLIKALEPFTIKQLSNGTTQ